MDQYDVIVVGGSVSGAPTATWLARKNYRVLVLDKSRFPRDANSTHFIWPRGMSYLNRLGVAEQVLSVTPSYQQLQINIESIAFRGKVPLDALKARFLQLHGNAHGVVDYYAGPRRHYLDAMLLKHAAQSGVDVKQETQVTGVIWEGDKVVGVDAVDANGKASRYFAPVVIGADGRISQFSTYVHAPKTAVREKSTFAYYGYFKGIDLDELVIHKKGRLGTAIFPTMDHAHLVLVYGPTAWWADFSRDAEKNFYNTYDHVAPSIGKQVRSAQRVEPFKSMGRMVAYHRKAHGPGWALVGDACSFKDQWTAMGITHSLRDAELISTYVDRFLRSQGTWEALMGEYSQVRMADYEAYWNMVCDGAEMNPYSAEQLQSYYALSLGQPQMDHFVGQVGDTISLETPAPSSDQPPDRMPQALRDYDPKDRGYELNFYQSQGAAQAVVEGVR